LTAHASAAPDGLTLPFYPRGAVRGFRGFGRCATDSAGEYRIVTLRPGPRPGAAVEAPHLDVSVFARGLLDRLVTRIYFPDEEEANAADPVLRSVADPGRRATLVAAARPRGRAGRAGSGSTSSCRAAGRRFSLMCERTRRRGAVRCR
jgi:protocatechuate 3,4-dioxygenase beta subunit